MTFDIRKIFEERNGENYDLHSRYINPQFARVLKTIGYDKSYTTAKGPIYGVIGRKPIHLLEAAERDKGVKLEDLWIDIGAENKKKAEKLVRVGDPVAVKANFSRLGQNRVVSKGLDDKIGAFVVAETLRELSQRKVRVGVYGVGSVQEELGLRGATTSTFGINPQVGHLAVGQPGHQFEQGLVQGGKFVDLRRESAQFIAGRLFDGFGIGGEFGEDKDTMSEMLRTVVDELPENRPRHLLGIGHPDDIELIIREGVDTFDCTVPTQYARHGTAFTSAGRVSISASSNLRRHGPLDPTCDCPTCITNSLSYICHLYRAKETAAAILLTVHNLHYFNRLVEDVRDRIRSGSI